MSTSPIQPDAPDTDELVAYLDGELSVEESRRVERRLTSDADYRRRLTELEQAWSALEELPQTVAGDDFARTTIEMVTVAAKRDVAEQSTNQSAVSRRRTWLAVAAGLAVTTAAFAAVRALVPNRNEVLVANLPVIAQLDVLTQVGDVDYLRGLAKLDIEPDPRNEITAAAAPAVEEWQTFDDRRRWIEALSPEKKAELAAKFDRFERLAPAPAAQDRLRTLERQIAEAPDGAELRRTLSVYETWILSRTQGEQLELRDSDLSTEERLQRVERLVAQSNRAARRQLSLEDEKALQDAILEIVEERRPEFLQTIKRQGHANAEQQIASQSAARVALVIIGDELRNDERRRKLQERLAARLSPEAQEYLDALESRQRGWQLWRWTYDALQPKLGPQSLEQFFVEELTPDRREYLLGLSYTEMQEQLKEWYMAAQVGLREEQWSRRFERRGPPGPGRGDWDQEGRPGERGRREGRRGDFDGERIERGPFPPGPGRPNGPPPPGGPPRGGPPRDRRDWRPPPNGGPPPREMGPPPEGGPPFEEGPPREEPI